MTFPPANCRPHSSPSFQFWGCWAESPSVVTWMKANNFTSANGDVDVYAAVRALGTATRVGVCATTTLTPREPPFNMAFLSRHWPLSVHRLLQYYWYERQVINIARAHGRDSLAWLDVSGFPAANETYNDYPDVTIK